MTVYSLFKKRVNSNPDSIAASFNGYKISYKKLAEESDKIAHLLSESGIKRGDIVGLCLNRSVEMIISLLGIIKAGAAYLPLDPFFPDKRLEYMLNDSAAGFLITESLLFPKFSYFKGKFIDVSEIKQIKLKSEVADKSDENNLAYLIYTSGSTGNPKGVQIAHYSLTNFLLSMQKTPGLTQEDNVLALTTLSFDISGLEIFLPLITGAKITIATREEAKDGKSLLNKIKKEKVTVVQATPSTWKMMIDSGWNEKLKLKALCGGEPLPEDLADKLLDRVDELWNMYGPTETTIWSSCSKVMKGVPIHLGKPIANTQFYIVDKDLNFCPPGVAGELLIGGAGLSLGYINREELTQEKFILNPFDKEKKTKVYRTGDLVKLNSNMQVEFLGRIDNQVKIRGYRIELEEIENAIKKEKEVEDCVVIVKEINNDKKIIAYSKIKKLPEADNAFENILINEWQNKWTFLYESAYQEYQSDLIQSDLDFDRAVASLLTKEKQLITEAYNEWLEQTISRIKELKPTNLLEIGCGGGQLIMQLAPLCKFIAASDFSESSINVLKERIKTRKDFPAVQLFVARADDDLPVPENFFDTVVINSVVQYFPSSDHLIRIINKAVEYLSDDGCLFIGDVQSFSLLENFHLNDQLNHISENETVEDFIKIVKNRIHNEKELVVDPEFFYNLPNINKRISRVEVKLRRGINLNETTQYHYDVFIYTKQKLSINQNFREFVWGKDINNLRTVPELLEKMQSDYIYISGIPNKRISLNIRREREIKAAPNHNKVLSLIDKIPDDENSISPEDVWNLAEQCDCIIEILVPGTGDQTCFDAVFLKDPTIDSYYIRFNKYPEASFDRFCNNPLKNTIEHEISINIKKRLGEILPDYMIPHQIIPIEEFPLTPNNKIDKKALENLDITGFVSYTSSSKAETEIQRTLVKIWEDLLGISGIGIDDNFFELGGHSILAAQMLAEFEKATGKKIPLASMFTSQTIRQLSDTIETSKPKLSWNPLVEIKKGNDKYPPLFLIHGAEGNVLLYRDLANRLNSELTVYGIQARGLSGKEYFHISIKEMAKDYVEIIRSVQPKGPYNIGGYCMGGTVAFEMAQQLSAAGEQVQNVFLLETYNACLLDPVELESNRLNDRIQNVKFHIENIRNLHGKDRINFIQSKARTALKRTSARISKITSVIFAQSDDDRVPEHIFLSLRDANDKAQAEYSPEVFNGKVVLLRPKVSFSTEPDPDFGWRDFVSGILRVHNLDVAPRGMLTEPFVKKTAEIIEAEFKL
ncbi:amino acid adenylation domain-containing protein [Ignavibacterium album]|uniref:amino acid adenylation domain-containing protein n=1 Tax=Ignavibacterium album TaxID=591197 RepID=UPI0035BAF2A9